MSRLFIRDFPKQTTNEELASLFGKISEVKEVYIPEPTITGIYRNFAVVTINDVDNASTKCIKAFNGSIWKGSKIRVEVANEWYKHKEQKVKVIDVKPDSSTFSSESESKHTWKRNIITIRRGYLFPIMKVSMKSRLSTSTSLNNKRIMCGTKTILDPYYDKGTPADETSAESDNDDDSDNVDDEKEIAVNSGTVDNAVKDVKPVIVSAPLSSHLLGGGTRKGFGTLLSGPLPKTSVAVSRKVDCCIDELGLSDEEEGDGYSSAGDRARCVDASELEEESLKRERMRALRVLQSMLGGTNDDEASVDFSNAESAHAMIECQNVSVLSSSSASRTGWNSVVMTRFDPSKQKSDKSTRKPDSIDPTIADSVAVDKKTTQVVEETTHVKKLFEGDFAEIDKLKNIFHREGGVWWESDEQLGGDGVMKGNVAQDLIFLEAEKAGIDVRGRGLNNDTPVEESMRFDFFSEACGEFLDEAEGHVSVLPEKEEALGHQLDFEASKASQVSTILQKRKLLPPVLPVELVATAKKFCRVKSIGDVSKEWLDGRDKLVLDYKRKFKDARKRLTANNTTAANLAAVAESEVKKFSVQHRMSGASGKFKRRGGQKRR